MEKESKKAWCITVPTAVDVYMSHDSEVVVWAETNSKAKSKVWEKNLNYIKDLEVYSDISEYLRSVPPSEKRAVKYTDLVVRRDKEWDRVEFDGKLVTKQEAERLKWVKDRDEHAIKLTKENPDAMFVVSNGDYGSYWGANRSGYTKYLFKAGRYTAEEALQIVLRSGFSRQETVQIVTPEQVNSLIKQEVDKLQEEINVLKSYEWN